MRYVCLLRGINVGGKNKVSMSELRACFEAAGFERVETYINSGNLFFDTDQTDSQLLARRCEEIIEATFGLELRVLVVSCIELKDLLARAPKWWGRDPAARHNALFVLPPYTAADILNAVGDLRGEFELAMAVKNVIFWSASIKAIGRTRFSRIVAMPEYRYLTIRNYNTTLKLLDGTK